ncbi:MAG TPA: LPS export ABC transporter periplasmic protein LptC [Armatimonadota bacterium]|nr:LPS export ABC transporter periplasmic protein LptC [Armatimonadota bacterium]
MRIGIGKALFLMGMAAALVVSAGCGSPPPPAAEKASAPSAASAPAPEEPAPSLEIEESKVTVVDPGGRWTFQAEAERMEAGSVHGPYTLTPARARYEEVGRPPALMTADKAQIDQESRRVVFEGDVRISSGGWTLEADRAEYDLDSGEVVATGRTKWTFSEGSGGAAESLSTDEAD